MTKLEVGKLYTCSEYQLLVFPTEERAATARARSRAVAVSSPAADWTGWWSKELKCHVSVIPAGRVFCAVEQGGETRGYHQVHVVAGEAMGWINAVDWLNIKELAAK